MRLLSVLVLTACVPDLVAEVSPVTLQRERVLQSTDGPVLAVDVQVTDADGHALPCDAGLLEASVTLHADGTSQPVPGPAVRVTCGEGGPPDVAMVLDNSGSQEAVLSQTREGARRLADEVLARGGRVGVVRVSTFSRVLQELSSDATAVDAALDGLFVNRGWTALWDGLRMGHEVLDTGRAATVHADLDAACAADGAAEVVLFTNGDDNNSAQERVAGDGDDGVDTTLVDVLGLRVDGVRTPVHAIGLGQDLDVSSLQSLTTTTGGGLLTLTELDGLPEAFDFTAGWTTQDRRVCARVDPDTCGTVEVEVAWTVRSPWQGDPCAEGMSTASRYDVVALRDFTNATDVEGAVLVGGLATLTRFSVGRLAEVSDTLVAGDLVASNGQVWGNATHARTASVAPDVGFVGGALRQDAPVDVDGVRHEVTRLSEGLATLTPTAPAQIARFGPVTLVALVGHGHSLEVFELDAADLIGLATLSVEVDPGATVVVNVRGGSIDVRNAGLALVGTDTRHVLWNAPEATSWRTTSIGWLGSILAPHAVLTVDNGNLDGTAIALDVQGTGEWHHHPFAGTLACPDACDALDCGGAVVDSGVSRVDVEVPCGEAP